MLITGRKRFKHIMRNGIRNFCNPGAIFQNRCCKVVHECAIINISIDIGIELLLKRFRNALEPMLKQSFSGRITNSLKGKFSNVSEKETQNLDAYLLFTKGRFHLSQRTESGISKATDFFRKAGPWWMFYRIVSF